MHGVLKPWLVEHDNEFSVLQGPPQSADLSPTERIWNVVKWQIGIMTVMLTNLQQLCDSIVSVWYQILEECFWHLDKLVT